MTNNLHHAIKNPSYQWIINKDQMVILVLKIDKFALNYLTLKQEIGTLKFNFKSQLIYKTKGLCFLSSKDQLLISK